MKPTAHDAARAEPGHHPGLAAFLAFLIGMTLSCPAQAGRSYVPATPPLGSPDVVWRNEASGNQVVWHLDFASSRIHGEFTNPTANTPALDWTVVGPR